jgi:hypothetical protein
MATKINRQILEAYLNCKTKAHLKLAGQQGIRSDYEGLLAETRQEVRKTAIDKMLARHAESEVARDISLTASARKRPPPNGAGFAIFPVPDALPNGSGGNPRRAWASGRRSMSRAGKRTEKTPPSRGSG